MIVVKTFAIGVGALLLMMSALGGPQTAPSALAAPANDNLASAIAISTPVGAPGIVAVGDNAGASVEGGETASICGGLNFTLWYTWTSPGSSGTAVLDTWGSTFDTVIAVYTGSAFPLTEVACNDDFAGTQGTRSATSFAYTPGTTYRIRVSSFGSGTGTAVLNMSLGAVIYVTDTLPFDTPDGSINLVEATKIASGTLGRMPQAGELTRVLNSAAAGAGGADLIHFDPAVFPTFLPTVYTPGIIPAQIITLSATNDTLSGVGAGVILDGIGSPVFDPCLSVSGSGDHVEGMQVRNCVRGITMTSNGGMIGGGLSVLQRNTIYSNSNTGLLVSGSANQILGNYIGTNPAGTGAAPNPNGIILDGPSNVIGGSGSGQGNLISGNGTTGISIGAAAVSTTVRGNMIGTDASGTAQIANGVGVAVFSSSNTIGGANAGEGNVISGNNHGVNISIGSSNSILGNKIGTNAAGTAAIPNTTYGVIVAAGQNNVVGGIGGGQGNLIATNAIGVRMQNIGVVRNPVRGNNIYANTTIGIDNQTGGNLELTPPSVTGLSGTSINGIACNSCTVDVYNDVGDQGRLYIGTTTANGSGLWTLGGGGHPLPNITAIAVDAQGNSSEFSAPFAAPIDTDGDGIPNAGDACASAAEDGDGFEDGDGCPDPDNDADGVCDAGQAALTCAGSDSGKLCFDPAGTLSCATQDCRSIAEDYDAFKDTDGCPEPDNDNDSFPDGIDTCPGTGAIAGADGVLGSPQDLNHNGIKDLSEATLTTDDTVLTFEDYDGVLDTDACHDSPGEDFDADGYTDDDEALKIGTNAGYPCGGAGWPSDVFSGGLSVNKLDVQDILSFVAPVRRLDTNPTGPTAARYDARWDLAPGLNSPFQTYISIFDITTMLNGTSNPPSPAYPSMLGGQRAFGRSCPLAAQ